MEIDNYVNLLLISCVSMIIDVSLVFFAVKAYVNKHAKDLHTRQRAEKFGPWLLLLLVVIYMSIILAAYHFNNLLLFVFFLIFLSADSGFSLSTLRELNGERKRSDNDGDYDF